MLKMESKKVYLLIIMQRNEIVINRDTLVELLYFLPNPANLH